MASINGDFLPQKVVLTATASVTVGAEPDNYLGVSLAGTPGTASRGVVVRTGDGTATIALSGIAPIKVATGVTIAAGANVSTNSSGLAIPTPAAGSVLGIALEGITTAPAGTFISMLISPAVFVPAT